MSSCICRTKVANLFASLEVEVRSVKLELSVCEANFGCFKGNEIWRSVAWRMPVPKTERDVELETTLPLDILSKVEDVMRDAQKKLILETGSSKNVSRPQ